MNIAKTSSKPDTVEKLCGGFVLSASSLLSPFFGFGITLCTSPAQQFCDACQCFTVQLCRVHIKLMLTNSVVVYKNFLIISHIWICIPLGQGIVLIVVGLVLRVIVSFLVVLGNGFTIKEMLLVAVAWLPKATVQVWKYFNS